MSMTDKKFLCLYELLLAEAMPYTVIIFFSRLDSSLILSIISDMAICDDLFRFFDDLCKLFTVENRPDKFV